MSECAHDKTQAAICSPKSAIRKLSKFTGVDGPNEKILEAAKKKTSCKTEACIYKNKEVQNFISNDEVTEILKEHFKPSGPAFSTEWLSNYNIDDVLDQFSKKHKSFYHVYFQMRDFEKNKLKPSEKANPEMLHRSLADIDFAKQIKEGTRSFGCVLNTDLSSGSGQHWFCLFGDFRKQPYQLEYFNSAGDAPLDEVQVWLDKTKHQIMKDTGKPVKLVICRTHHQRDGHSCGPYSLFYIVNRLKGVPSEAFNKDIGGDARMLKWRKELFIGD